MHILKIRRVGNSNVVSLPRKLEERGFTPGTHVMVEETDAGELRIVPIADLDARIRAIGRRVIEENNETLDMLAAYDRGDTVGLEERQS